MIIRSAEYALTFPLTYVDNSPATGKASEIVVKLIRDGSSPVPASNSVEEISGSAGWYRIVLTSDETDCNSLGVIISCSDPAVVCPQFILFTDRSTITSLVSDAAQAVWAYTIEASESGLEWMRLIGSVLFGKRTYSNGNVIYRDYNDTKNRIVGTEDQDGNRTIISRDGS